MIGVGTARATFNVYMDGTLVSTPLTTPYFLINNGSGAFTRSDAGLPSVLTTGAKPNHWSEAFLDVDGDGDKDLFLGSSLNSPAQLLLNNGQGVFTLSSAMR